MSEQYYQYAHWLLLAAGVVSVTSYASNFISYLHLHFLHRGGLKRYRTDNKDGAGKSWALVTGATDGIGRCFVEELAQQGFNVIIHGRNEKKLAALKGHMEEKFPNCKVRTLRIDAGKETSDPNVFERTAADLKDINLRVLINNVGGSGGLITFMPLHERPSNEVQTFIDVNARFPIEITKALLPQLRAKQPALILNIGSASSEFGLPYLSVYASCKAANRAWSDSLSAEMRAEDIDIEVLFVYFSAVSTDLVPRDTSPFVPTAKQMAEYTLDKVGCGKDIIFGHWGHELQARIFWALPTFLKNKMVIDIGKQEKYEDEERYRKNN